MGLTGVWGAGRGEVEANPVSAAGGRAATRRDLTEDLVEAAQKLRSVVLFGLPEDCPADQAIAIVWPALNKFFDALAMYERIA